ncbi:MAG: acyltransferase [Anaerolinea sp.]|nr:acyltransferase [Anaerolinea sp.]
MSEIKALTSLRMIAALLVFFHHFYPFTRTGDVLENILIEGHIGVTIFFVLSGFLIALRYYDKFHDTGLTRAGLVDYYRKRVARIYPLYAFLLITSLFFPLSLLGLVEYSLTQGFFENAKFAGIPTAWSLTVEESFYFLLPLIAMRRTRSKIKAAFPKLLIVTLCLLLLGALIVIVSNVTALARVGGLGFMASSTHMMTYTIFGRFLDFAVGILIAVIFKHSRIRVWFKQRTGRIGAELLVIGGLIWVGIFANVMHINGGYAAAWVFNYGVSIGAGLVILGLTNEQTFLARALSFPLFVYLGKVSYALYLLQATWLFWNVKPENFIIPTASPLVYFILLYTAANLVSALLYQWVETPMRNFILRRTEPSQ